MQSTVKYYVNLENSGLSGLVLQRGKKTNVSVNRVINQPFMIGIVGSHKGLCWTPLCLCYKWKIFVMQIKQVSPVIILTKHWDRQTFFKLKCSLSEENKSKYYIYCKFYFIYQTPCITIMNQEVWWPSSSDILENSNTDLVAVLRLHHLLSLHHLGRSYSRPQCLKMETVKVNAGTSRFL